MSNVCMVYMQQHCQLLCLIVLQGIKLHCIVFNIEDILYRLESYIHRFSAILKHCVPICIGIFHNNLDCIYKTHVCICTNLLE